MSPHASSSTKRGASSPGIIAAVVTLIVGGVIGYAIGNSAAVRVPGSENTNLAPAGISAKEIALRQDMRELWTDHVVWTRGYAAAAIAGTPDADAAAARLMKNQEDIGAAVAAYYGGEAGNKLTGLLKEHIAIAVDLIQAAKVNDQAKFNDADAKWKQNANEIADFLSSANPNWPQSTLRAMMAKHLQTTVDEVSARLKNDHAADVRAFDLVYDHILMMADALSSGIVKQFPDRFK